LLWTLCHSRLLQFLQLATPMWWKLKIVRWRIILCHEPSSSAAIDDKITHNKLSVTINTYCAVIYLWLLELLDITSIGRLTVSVASLPIIMYWIMLPL
jgi:hypothetical protein